MPEGQLCVVWCRCLVGVTALFDPIAMVQKQDCACLPVACSLPVAGSAAAAAVCVALCSLVLVPSVTWCFCRPPARRHQAYAAASQTTQDHHPWSLMKMMSCMAQLTSSTSSVPLLQACCNSPV